MKIPIRAAGTPARDVVPAGEDTDQGDRHLVKLVGWLRTNQLVNTSKRGKNFV